MNTLIEKAINTRSLTQKEIVALLGNDTLHAELLKAADEVRRQNVGDEVHLRGLIEFSNICRNNCLYCGLQRSNHKLERYHLEEEALLMLARHAVNDLGFKTIVLQSGEDMYYDTARMCRIVEGIKKLGVALTLSIGERSYEDYKAFREAGADRYLIRIETTDQELYHRLDPGMSWQKRYECLLMIKELGYEVGSGIMVGLPDQSLESIGADLLFLQNLPVDMAGIGPFIPHPETPLKDERGGSLELALRTMAIMRLLLPKINIPATTAMESLHPKGRIMALQGGANVVMPNVTVGKFRKLYELYPDKACINDTPDHCRKCIELKIRSIGRTIGTDAGQSKSYSAD